MTSEIPLPGRLIDVSGGVAHIDVRGDGDPTVVLLSGLGANSLVWSLVQPDMATITRVVSYDRAGLGSSSLSDRPRTPANIAVELHELLAVADIPAPYVLVGHSMGGVHARAFTRRYPAEVAGLVFVDSSHERQRDRLPQPLQSIVERKWDANIQPLRQLTREQLQARLCAAPPDAALPAFVREIEIARAHPDAITGMIREREAYRAGIDEPFPITLGDLPVAVLTNVTHSPDETPEFNAGWSRVWLEMQAEIAALSTRASHRHVEGGHFLHLSNPSAVIAAIHEVVAVRAG